MPQWNQLPAEVKEMILQRLNKNTRNSLRVCSKSSKLLVEGTKLKSLYFLIIHESDGEWIIDTKQCQYHLHSQSFASFEELQANLMKILKSIDCIENLIVSLPISTPPVKLINNEDQSRLLVECVVIKGEDNSQKYDILSQLEPVYLSTIVLNSDAQNSRIYDMEQVVHAETLKVYGRSCIREDQLLKLNANHVIFKEATCSISNYVNKCTLKTGTSMRIFEFGASSFSDLGLSNISTESPFNKLDIHNSKLCFDITFEKRVKEESSHSVSVFGNLQYDNNSNKSNFWRCDRSLLRILPSLRISHNSKNRSWNITVKSLSLCREKYKFQDFGEFQEKLDEIMENVDFIKDFSVKLTGSQEDIKWKPRKKQFMVKKLLIEVDNGLLLTVYNLLKLIDPSFPMDVKIVQGIWINNSHFYRMPQIQNASRINIYHPYLTDSELLEMKQFNFSIAGGLFEDPHCSVSLTPAGISKFLKKCVCNVGRIPINFNLGRLPSYSTTAELRFIQESYFTRGVAQESIENLLFGRFDLNGHHQGMFNINMAGLFNHGRLQNAENMVELLKLEGLDIIKVIEYQDKKQIVINCDHSDFFMNLIVSSQLDISGFVSYRNQTHPCYLL